MNNRKQVALLGVSYLIVLGALLFILVRPSQKEETVVAEIEDEISITVTGDFLFEQALYNWMDNYQFGSYFDGIKPYLDSDLTIANIEVPIAGEEMGVSGVAYTFNAPEQIAQQLPDIGIDYVTFANNHTLDMGLEGLNNTLDNLDAAGIQHTGAFRTEEEASQISVVDVQGVKIAVLAYTYNTNQPRVGEYVPYFLNEYQEFDAYYQEKLTNDIANAKSQADMVFVAMHWGTEFTYELTYTQTQVAQFLNDQGVDLVIGNHPHNIQSATTLVNAEGKETVVFYSLGNTVSSAVMVDRAQPEFQNMYEVGALANMKIVKDGENYRLDDIKVIPFVNHFEEEYTNFQLIPFSEYNQDLASRHYQASFNSDFNYDWLNQQIHQVFDESGFLSE